MAGAVVLAQATACPPHLGARPQNIHEFSAAMNKGQGVRELMFDVHAHPTVAEVNEELIRHAHSLLEKKAVVSGKPAAKQPVAA